MPKYTLNPTPAHAAHSRCMRRARVVRTRA